MDQDPITPQVIGAAIRVHTELGPGLLENAYEACLAYELRQSGLSVRCQLDLPLHYRGITLDVGYRMDMLVEELVVVELKVVDAILPVHCAQLLSYLRLSQKPIGLLLNFKVSQMRQGIRRIVNGYVPPEGFAP